MYLSTFSILFPVFVGAVFIRTLTKPLRVLYAYILVCAALELTTAIMHVNGINNLLIFNAYTLIEFTFLSVVFRMLFPYGYQKTLVTGISIAVGIYFAYTLLTEDLFMFNTKNRIVEGSVILLYALWYIATILNRLKPPYFQRNPYFLLACGLFIYFAGTMFVFAIENRLDESNVMPAWTIHSLLNLFLNIVFMVVIWRSKSSSRT